MEPIQTLRLRLVPWDPGHTALLTRLSALPEVIRYVGDGRPWAAARAEEVSAAQLEHWRAHGFGWRAAIDAASGEELGLIALNYAGEGTPGVEPTEHEIGWWLDPRAWGRGIAQEGARAICAEAFDRLAAPGVVARVQPANARSLRVATSLALSRELETVGRAGEPVTVLRMSAAAWGSRAAVGVGAPRG